MSIYPKHGKNRGKGGNKGGGKARRIRGGPFPFSARSAAVLCTTLRQRCTAVVSLPLVLQRQELRHRPPIPLG